MKERVYLCIDLKSFYASVECMERNLDPITTNLVVADSSRTEKTICLAVTPALKAYGISGRARLFEVVQKVKDINIQRKKHAPNRRFSGKSCNETELKENPSLELSYLIAPPRMAHYMEYSTRIYQVYLNYVAPEDIHVYSIDEVFMDITDYLSIRKQTPREFAKTIIQDVLKTTGITATAGIGTNLYLAKVAMDIEAKHALPDEDGVRIAELDEMQYRRQLWNHRPLTDFWRVGKGYAVKLEQNRLYTMGDIARCSLNDYGENLLYRLFGVNAELLIDHAWGWEPCTMKEIKAYRPEHKSLGSGQVLHQPYPADKARLVVKEMLELLALDLVEKGLVTDRVVLTVGYDIENLTDPTISRRYQGEVTTDFYGRKVPKHAHGTAVIGKHTASYMLLSREVLELFDRIVDPSLLVRRINLSACHVMREEDAPRTDGYDQLDFFTDYKETEKQREREELELKKERSLQETMLDIKQQFGKNTVLKGTNLQEGATGRERNKQIGGHKA
ncbi:MAG: DNA methylase [Clostridia bacterium]|nr:DNA methylase [Clostridia bacterium]